MRRRSIYLFFGFALPPVKQSRGIPAPPPPRRRLPAAAGSPWLLPRRAAARSQNRPHASSGGRLDSRSPWALAADALRPHEVGQDPKHRQVEDLGRGGGGGLPPLLLAQRP